MIKTIEGTYGSGKTEAPVFVEEMRNYAWYVVEGGSVVNKTYEIDKLVDGVDVETLSDADCFTWDKPIDSEEEFETALES